MARFKIYLRKHTDYTAEIELEGTSLSEIIAGLLSGELDTIDLSDIRWEEDDSHIEVIDPTTGTTLA